jgi:formate/nitrite transporter FocA (FNT family)
MTGRLNFLSLILLTFVGNIISGYALVFAYYFVSKSVKKANNSVTITDNKNIEQEKN